MHLLVGVFLVAQFTATLDPKTLGQFENYVRGVDSAITSRAGSISWKVDGISNTKAPEIAGGQIHDWTAAAFVPGVKKERVISILEGFGEHARIYPEVLIGRTDRRDGNRIYAFHRLRKRKVLEVTLEAKYKIDVVPVAANRYFSRSETTEIVEIDNAGKAGEQRLPPGNDHGYLWKLHTYWTLEETPQGLWMEVRSISLTRDVPMALGWAIKPIVRELPRESLAALMDATKKAVLAQP